MMPYISISNTKLGSAIPCVNFPPIITCRPDAPCQHGCYACKGRFMFPNVQKSLQDNLIIYLANPHLFFDYINLYLKQNPFKYFRYFASGDIVDERFLKGMCDVAISNPTVQFLCFTKKDYLVNNYLNHENIIPENLVIVFSFWGTSFIPENPYNLPTAHVIFKNIPSNIPDNAVHCNEFCGTCCNTENSCWKMQKGDSVVFKKH